MISIQDLIKVAMKKGYAVFENDHKPFNLNYWGVRQDGGDFNDEFHLFWKYKGNWSHIVHRGTTDPGKHYLEHPLNHMGCAILPEGQYRGTWQLGKHKKAYDALIQKKTVQVYRDDNLDAVLDMDKLDKPGFYGINHHRAHSESELDSIGKYSAGCQVRNNPYEYGIFISLCKMAAVHWGDSFTYTLINKTDL